MWTSTGNRLAGCELDRPAGNRSSLLGIDTPVSPWDLHRAQARTDSGDQLRRRSVIDYPVCSCPVSFIIVSTFRPVSGSRTHRSLGSVDSFGKIDAAGRMLLGRNTTRIKSSVLRARRRSRVRPGRSGAFRGPLSPCLAEETALSGAGTVRDGSDPSETGPMPSETVLLGCPQEQTAGHRQGQRKGRCGRLGPPPPVH